MGWLFVPGLEASNSECELQPEETSVWCVMSSGKPMRQPLSWRGWKTRPWISRLSGTISRPSTAALGAARWIASQRASPANPTASPASASDTPTSAPCGPSSSGSSPRPPRRSSSLKTRPIFFTTSDLFGTSYGAWVSSSRRHCYRPPRTSAPRTNESGSLSLLPTPRASDGCKGGPNQRGSKGDLMMPSFIAMLPTPLASDQRGSAGVGKTELSDIVMALPTPLASQRRARGRKSEGGEVLDARVNLLPTPVAMDSHSSGAVGYLTASGRPFGTTLTDAVLGAASAGRIGKLNPRLSEWMQGFPVGWMSCAPLEIQSFQIWLRQRGLT